MAFISLQQYRLLDIQGEDAEKYLQGQLTCDVSKLAVGQSTITAHCDPKGKVNSIFRLMRLSENQFYALIRAPLLETALQQLKKYAVFSKVSFSELDKQIVANIGETAAIEAEFCVELPFAQLWIEPKSAVNFDHSFEQWDYLEIQQGYPILSDKTQGEFIPQALNLQCLEQAISFQKGCYIGQETVARAKYRGINKRAMFSLKADNAAQVEIEIGGEIEMQLENGWRKTGTILSAVHFGESLWLQVVLSNDIHSEQAFRLPNHEIALHLQPLPYELTH